MTDTQLWSYQAETPNGAFVKGQITADTERLALLNLREQKLKPIELRLTRNTSFVASFMPTPSRLSSAQMTVFVRALSDLLGAGIPLSETLSMLEAREKRGPVKLLSKRLLDQVRSGQGLSDALRVDPVNQPRLMMAMVEAGEATGTLPAQMERFADAQEKAQNLRRDLIGQLLYPMVLCLLVILTIFFLSFLVLPEFETIFSDGDVIVPPETRFILDAGAWIRNWGGAIPLIFAGILLVGQYLVKTRRLNVEALVLKLPLIGSFLMVMESGKFCRALGVMLRGGMSIVPALEVARKPLGFESLRERHQNAAENVRAGAPLAQSLSQFRALQADALRFIELGERTGEMGAMVSKAADDCEAQVKTGLKRFTDLLSPILTILMGLVTAGVIGSVMSGVLSLNETVY